MKSFVATSSDMAKPDKFLAYMVPSPNELVEFLLEEKWQYNFNVTDFLSVLYDRQCICVYRSSYQRISMTKVKMFHTPGFVNIIGMYVCFL